jgi:hypothetical protein
MPKLKPTFLNNLVDEINQLNEDIPNLAYYIATGILVLLILSNQ